MRNPSGKKVKGLPVYVTELIIGFNVTVPSFYKNGGEEKETLYCFRYEPGNMKKIKDGEVEIFFDVLILTFPNGDRKFLTIERYQRSKGGKIFWKYTYSLDVNPATEKLKFWAFIKRNRKKFGYNPSEADRSLLSLKNARYSLGSGELTEVREFPLDDVSRVLVTVDVNVGALYRGEEGAYSVACAALDFYMDGASCIRYRAYKKKKMRILTVIGSDGKYRLIGDGNYKMERGRR